MLGMEWDLSIISEEFAELVDKEVKSWLDLNSTERSRDQYFIHKVLIFTGLPMQISGRQYGAYTSVQIGIGRKRISQVMSFTMNHDNGRSWMSSSVDLLAAQDALDFSRS